MAVHATKSAKTRGKKMMTMLDPFGKSKRRVQKKYLVCRNGLKFEVIYIPQKITSWYQPIIKPTERKLPRYGRFLWILRLPWERSLSDSGSGILGDFHSHVLRYSV